MTKTRNSTMMEDRHNMMKKSSKSMDYSSMKPSHVWDESKMHSKSWAPLAMLKFDNFYYFGLSHKSRLIKEMGYSEKNKKAYWYPCMSDTDCDGMSTCCAKIGLYWKKEEKSATRCMKTHVVKGGTKTEFGGVYSAWTECISKKKEGKKSRWFKPGSMIKSFRRTRSGASYLSFSVAAIALFVMNLY